MGHGGAFNAASPACHTTGQVSLALIAINRVGGLRRIAELRHAVRCPHGVLSSHGPHH